MLILRYLNEKVKVFMMGSLNINSLNKHINELRVFVADKSFGILAINETISLILMFQMSK